MPKMKTHSGAKKRFKRRSSGKIARKRATAENPEVTLYLSGSAKAEREPICPTSCQTRPSPCNDDYRRRSIRQFPCSLPGPTYFLTRGFRWQSRQKNVER